MGGFELARGAGVHGFAITSKIEVLEMGAEKFLELDPREVLGLPRPISYWPQFNFSKTAVKDVLLSTDINHITFFLAVMDEC